YAHQVMWDGWVDVEKTRVHLIGHWNYEANVKKPIYAVSSAEKVELFINGKSRGFGEQSSRFLYTWPSISFEAGEIKAIGYDASGKQICQMNIKTVGEPVSIKLTPHTAPQGLKADGADIALVDVEVVDANGQRCPLALNPITFDLQGPAEWRGGIAQVIDNGILSKELPVECGINRIAIRTSTQAGEIVLKANTPGLKSAEIKLTSTAFPTIDGLSKTLPDEGLKSRLERGPTPAGDSVTPTRTPIRIVSATAGANSDSVAAAFDDNEETSWKNNGKRATAWIQFKLERPAQPNELTLKLGGWRKLSYPVRITLNGTEVYNDITSRNLGYITLPLKPAKGDELRIELIGPVQEEDLFGMVEVTGKKLDDAVSTGNEKGTLEILEAEVYEPLATEKR
ncbi:MAG: DUF4982 domain-containing protein, partial [Luteolibacter sp.]